MRLFQELLHHTTRPPCPCPSLSIISWLVFWNKKCFQKRSVITIINSKWVVISLCSIPLTKFFPTFCNFRRTQNRNFRCYFRPLQHHVPVILQDAPCLFCWTAVRHGMSCLVVLSRVSHLKTFTYRMIVTQWHYNIVADADSSKIRSELSGDCIAITCNKIIEGSFHVKWTKKMENSTHHHRFSSNLISS